MFFTLGMIFFNQNFIKQYLKKEKKDHAADALFPSHAERIAQTDVVYIGSKLQMQLDKNRAMACVTCYFQACKLFLYVSEPI